MSPPSEQTVRPRSTTSGTIVLLALVAFVAAGIGGLWFAYTKLVAYERRAALHIPVGARAAARVDFEQVVLFEPVRRHVFPVVSQQLTRSDGLAEIEAATGVDLSADLREVMFVQPLSTGEWLIALGGLFPHEGVVGGLAALVSQRGVTGCAVVGERLSCPSQSFFAEQAGDGTVIFASDPALLEAALEPTREFERLGLALDDAAGFGMDGEWLQQVGEVASMPLLAQFASGLAPLADVQNASGHVELGTETTVTVLLRPLPAKDLQQLVPRIDGMLDTIADILSLLGHREVAGERTMLAKAQVTANPDGTVAIVAPWARQDIDRAARALADWLSGWADARQPD